MRFGQAVSEQGMENRLFKDIVIFSFLRRKKS